MAKNPALKKKNCAFDSVDDALREPEPYWLRRTDTVTLMT